MLPQNAGMEEAVLATSPEAETRKDGRLSNEIRQELHACNMLSFAGYIVGDQCSDSISYNIHSVICDANLIAYKHICESPDSVSSLDCQWQ